MGDSDWEGQGDPVSPAVLETLEPYRGDPLNAALIRVAEVAAATIDAMPVSVRGMMFPQQAGILLRALRELEQRSKGRQKPGSGGGKAPVSRLDALRAARAAGQGRKRSG